MAFNYIPATPTSQQPQQRVRQRESSEFVPRLSAEQTRNMIEMYKKNPNRANPAVAKSIENHANYHNIPFYSGEFSASEAIMQLAKGVFSGFTTFNVGKAPDNEYEAIARSIGHLIGFAPGIIASPMMKIKALQGWAGALGKVKSVPFMGAHFIRKKASQIIGPATRAAIKGRADAAGTVGKFLTSGAAKHVAEGAFDLGIASGISAWQGGVNAMVESTFHGAVAGGVFRTLGNAVKLGDPTATKLTRGLAGSLFMGLQAEHRGATTPEKVYEYLLGGFFGFKEAPWQVAGSAKFMKKFNKKAVKDAHLDVTKDPELMGEEWTRLEPEIQEQVRKDLAKFYPEDVGRIIGYDIIEKLGLKDEYGNIPVGAWEKVRNVLRGKETEEGVEISKFAEIPTVETAKERLVAKISKIEKDIAKDASKMQSLQEAYDKEEAVFKESGKKSAMFIFTADKIEELAIRTKKNVELKERLAAGIGEDILSEPETVKDTDSDVGEKTSETKVGLRSVAFTDKWLKDTFKLADIDYSTQRDLRTIVAHRVHDELIKYVEPGKSPNSEKLADKLQKELGTPFSREARGELRQWLNSYNKGTQPYFLRITYTPGRRGTKTKKGFAAKIQWTPTSVDNPVTMAGNSKKGKEPVTTLEEIYLKENLGELDSKYGTVLHIDHISMKNRAGHWKDYELSSIRKDKPGVYKDTLDKIIKDMHKKNFYLFGGRGDKDKLYFIKYHPKAKEMMKQNRLGKTMNALIGPMANRKKEYKEAFELFKKNHPKIDPKQARIMFDRAFMSNILYDMAIQGYTPTGTNLKKIWGPQKTTGFIGNPLDYNKRLQILLTPAWAGSKEFAKTEFANDKLFNKHKGFRYSIVKDISELAKHDKDLLEFEARFWKEITDGAIIGRNDVVDYNNKDAGQPPSGQNKAFIHSPDPDLGALLGKFMFHKAGNKLSEQMKKEDVHYLIYKSSAKQEGKREVGDYSISPRGKLTIDAEKYTLDPSHIKYNYSVKQHSDMFLRRHRIPKQWFSSLNSRTAYSPIPLDLITDIFNETIGNSYAGQAKWNKMLSSYQKAPTPLKLNKLINNIDKIGVNELLEVAYKNEGTEFADAVYERLLKLNKEIVMEDARESGLRESEVEEYSQEINSFDTFTNRILQQAMKVAKGKDIKSSPIYLHSWVHPYRMNVMRNYIMSHIAKPKIGNSMSARMRPYDKALMMDLDKVNPDLKLLNTRDDIFFLDENYRALPLTTHLGGKWKKTTLGELWDAYSGTGKKGKETKKQFKGLEKEVDEILRAMAIRVPMDSVSGAQALKFMGFTGRDGHGVLLHPRTMKALGGADLDGDEAFVYFGGKDAKGIGEGMKKEWKDAFEANKDEYVEYVSREKNSKGEYIYLSAENYNNLPKAKKKLYAQYIPDPKEGMVNRPDGKYSKDSMRTLLTEGDSDFAKRAGSSQVWMYAPSIRREVSERVVDSRGLMSGVVSMTGTMKSAHDIISTKENGADVFEFKDWNSKIKVSDAKDSNYTNARGENFYVPTYQLEVKARTDKKWLDYARRLSASMTAFTADPMDVGGLKTYPEYFKQLYDAYFTVGSLNLLPKPGSKKSKEISIKTLEDFFDFFKPGKTESSPIWKLRNGVLNDFVQMNSALFGKNYKAGRMWQENEIRNKVEFIKEFDDAQLTNIMAKQAKMVSESPKWTDNIFDKIDKVKLEELYIDMNVLAKEHKFLAGMMGRTSFTIPQSIFVKRILDYRAMSHTQRESIANNEKEFLEFMLGNPENIDKNGKVISKKTKPPINYTRNKFVSVPERIKLKDRVITKWKRRRETPEEFRKNIRNLSNNDRLEVLNDVFNKAQDYIVNDIHTMITLKRITDLYKANKDVLDMTTIQNIFNEVEGTKKRSYLLRKERMDEDAYRERTDDMTPDELDAYNFVIKKMIESGERKVGEVSASLDQAQIDKRIKAYKATLNTNVEKKLYDYLMLGTYNRNEMAKRSFVDLKDPDMKHEFIMKGAKTSLTRLGYASTAIPDVSIRDFLRDYMNLGSKTFKANETEIKKAIKASKKMDEVKIKVDGQDGEVTLFETSVPEKIVNTYVEDLSGYEGLVKGKLKPEHAKIVTELAENLRYYAKGNTIKLNEIVRNIRRKDLNVMDLQDWKIVNNFFRDLRRGSFSSRLNNENTPDMRQRYWNLFPKTVSKQMMKYDIQFLKKQGYFKTKSGEWKPGWSEKPVWILEGLQDWNGTMGSKAIDLGEKLQLELNSTLSFYTDAMPEGEKLRRIAIRGMELRQINRVLNETVSQKSDEVRRQQAAEYNDKYIEEIGGSTKNHKTAKPTGEAKIVLEKSYNMTNPDGTKSKMTGSEIVDKIASTYKSMNKRAHEIMVGKPEALEPYIKGYFANGEKKLDWNKFVKDIQDRYNQGLGFPIDFGIDGLRQMARSMMIDFVSPTTKYGRELLRKLKSTNIEMTGKLEYGSFYPHMFQSRSEVNKAMESAIEAIKRDPKLTGEKEDAELKKVLLRHHNLTGDWIDPGQEIWDAWDRASGEILEKKTSREGKINWWDSNQRMGSMHSRNAHIPGWDIGRNTYEVYLRNVANTYFNQMNQIFSRHMIETFNQRGKELGWHKEITGTHVNAEGEKVESNLLYNWINYLKLYAQDAMGNPSVIPERIYNDPSMKLKGTPYYWWADNRVKKSMERMKNVVIGENAGKYPQLDKLMKEMDYSTLNKISNLEAKWELASLLAHPKSSAGNLFGGSMHTVQSAGLENFKKGRDLAYLNKINPKWKTMADIDAFVVSHGVIPEFIMYALETNPDIRAARVTDFAKDIGRKMSKSGELDETTFRELAKKHNVSKRIMDIAAKFMSVPEKILRRQAFMAHYVKAHEMYDGAIKDHNHPLLIELAKKGVKATQFLYSAPYRPAFARTALGKIMSRFQLWQWNAVRFRNDITREAKIYGVLPGMPEFETFTRTMQMDMFVMAMGSAFAYSIFDTAMPAPYSWFQDTADWLFGSETERDRAFFGAWPAGLAPLQMVTPPVMRHPLSVAQSLYSGEWDRFANYHVYTMFPFGRLAKDFLAPNNFIQNPMGLIDKWTGFPMQGLSRESKRMRKGKGPWYPWAPYGVER